MSIIDIKLELDQKGKIVELKHPVAGYQPTGLEKDRLMLMRSCFSQGYLIMSNPRYEFNDLSMLERTAVDQMSFGVYQPNDGDALDGDVSNGWRSRAVRPIVRNKVMSIAAHVTARTLFPKIVAFDDDSKEQHDAAQIMSDLIEWSTFNTNSAYADVSLNAVISALVNPVSIVYTEYATVYRTVKMPVINEDGTRGWVAQQMLDEDLSGFRDEVVPPDQFYVQDFFQPDMQKQGWVIRRRVRPFSLMQALYNNDKYPNFEFVRAGVQVIFNDANQTFYEAYDTSLRQDECEEVIYWNKGLDLELIEVNGILLTDADEPNRREDKLYPFSSFGYEPLRATGDSFYWKSLAFKTMPDDKIINTLYPMFIDGSYLALFPPMINIGGEMISSDVIAPGIVTTLQNPNSDLKPLVVASESLKAGLDALMKVQESIEESAMPPLQQGDLPASQQTAFAMERADQNAFIQLGPFLNMVARYVKQMGRLRIGDIKQHLTLPQVETIEGSGNTDLIYQTFVLPSNNTRREGKRIVLDGAMPDQMTSQEHLSASYNILKEEKGSGQKISRVNPTMFRNLKFMTMVSADVVKPMSEALERQYGLEEYDRMVQAPNMFDPGETGRLLLDLYPATKKHPEKYIAKNPQGGMPSPMQPQVNQPAIQG